MTKTEMSDLTTKVLAFLGGLALHFCALINGIIAAMALFTGTVAGAIGEASEQGNLDADLTASANHAATVAKIIAIAFGVLAALELGAGELLRRRLRNIVVPIAVGATVAGEVAFSVWIGKFTSLDAMLIGASLFAGYAWWRLPRPTSSRAMAYAA